MAIFGTLSDIGLLELLSMLSQQNGAVTLSRGRDVLELYVSSGKLACAFRNGEPMAYPQLIDSILDALRGNEAEETRFVFQQEDIANRCSTPIGIPVNKLIFHLATLKDEIDQAEHSLPHPRAIFVLADLERSKDDPKLHEFLSAAQPYLAGGASAEELAQRMGLSLKQTRVLMAKARVIGSLRLREKERVTHRSTGLVGRLLSLFR